ncbi:hypothetical protein [Curtobacterium sp. USHLN213]|uniref:hypothetical protein n=1 Tax=Curtobacterium sp. USHLN213 TaxID=3081255 RepID=UPI00301AF485
MQKNLARKGLATIVGCGVAVSLVGGGLPASASPRSADPVSSANDQRQQFVPLVLDGGDSLVEGAPFTVSGRATPNVRVIMVTSLEPARVYQTTADSAGRFSLTRQYVAQGSSTTVRVTQGAGEIGQEGRQVQRTITIQKPTT